MSYAPSLNDAAKLRNMSRTPESLVYFQQKKDAAEDRKTGDIRAAVARNVNRTFARNADRKAKPETPRDGEIVFDGSLDSFRRIADFDDSTPIATPYHAAREWEAKRNAAAEADFSDVCKTETGKTLSKKEIEKQRRERKTIREQSHKLAEMLEEAGTPAYRNDAFSLWVYYIHSQQVEKIPNFRRICLLPYVAAIVRASKLSALEYWLQRNLFARFWTFSSGIRCGIEEVGNRVSDLAERLRRLNKHLQKKWGVEIVFRSTELGSVSFAKGTDDSRIEYDENGEPLFHVHAHCVVNSKVGYIPPKRWQAMIADVWQKWGQHWDAGQMIRNARECCKYVTKPADMLKLKPAQLAALEAQLRGKRLVTPLGSLKAEIAARKKAHKTLRRQSTEDGTIWREAFDHNAHKEQSDAEREETFERHRAELRDRIDAENGFDHLGRLPRKGDMNVCDVFGRIAPSIGPEGLKEPRVIVGGTHFDRRKINNHPLVSRLWAETVQSWEAGRAKISVHTGTSIGQPELDLPSPPPWEEAFEPMIFEKSQPVTA